jgi:hypothetical protein
MLSGMKNQNFYLAAATVIPILLLAISLQSDRFSRAITTATRRETTARKQAKQPLRPEIGGVRWVATYAGLLLCVLVSLIAELGALLVLYFQRSVFALGPFIFLTTAVLFFAVYFAIAANVDDAEDKMQVEIMRGGSAYRTRRARG